MTLFIVAAVVMVALALALLATALRSAPAVDNDGHARDRINVRLYKDRLAELARERDAGNIGGDDYEAAQRELQRDLLVSVGDDTAVGPGRGRWAVPLVALALPAAAVALYAALGAPALLDGVPQRQAHGAAGQQQAPDVQQMVARLQQRLEENPEDVEGWAMLGRSLAVTERFGEAAEAYRRAVTLQPDNPDLLGHYAEAAALAQGGTLAGRPAEAAARALELDPDHPMGLWLSGMSAFQAGQRGRALELWQRLAAILPPDDPSQRALAQVIAEARAEPSAAAAAGEGAVAEVSLPLRVTVAPELAARLTGSETVFVFARAPGTRMPLAVERHSVVDLPLAIVLDAADGMGQGGSLDGLDRIEVVARISTSGGVMAQSGDLEGQAVVTPGSDEPIVVTVDRILP